MLVPAVAVALLSATLGSASGLVDSELIGLDPPVPLQAPPGSGIVWFGEGAWEGSQAHTRYIVYGPGNGDHVPQAADSTSYIMKAGSGFVSVGVFSEEERTSMKNAGYNIIPDIRLEFDGFAGDATGLGDITGSGHVLDTIGYGGSGVTVGVFDTGVDFSNTDIRGALARDGLNRPVMLDADGQGIVLTNATFVADIDRFGKVRNYTGDIPENATSRVYANDDGVFLDINRGGRGTIISVYNSFYPYAGGSPVLDGIIRADMKIGDADNDYIVSKSGVYHLGVLFQPQILGGGLYAHVVPVLVTDQSEAGVYDTITADMSTAWEDFTRFDLPRGEAPDYDFDFTDETEIQIGEGNEFLVYDSDGDGRDNYSAGTVGAYVLDVYDVIDDREVMIDHLLGSTNGTLLSPMDPDGNYFGLMTDFGSHGSAAASTVAAGGQREYDVYGDEKRFSITGVAPDASILPVKVLWFGDVLYAWMWAAGFDNNGTAWEYSNRTRADIFTNSWGVPEFPIFETAPGQDALSIISGMITTPGALHPDHPGSLMVISAGNDGPGYGTISLPISPYDMAVGATSNNVFVGYGSFDEQPRFGSTTVHRNHIVDFSSRGPMVIGDPKPDIVTAGAYGFASYPVTESSRSPDNNPVGLWGGTSMSAPAVAGGAAVVMEALRENGMEPDPFLVKNILMSTATDINNDPLVQGAGMLNVTQAVEYIRGVPGRFIVHNDASYGNIRDMLDAPISRVNHTGFGIERFEFPDAAMPMTSWFAGHMEAGQRSMTSFTLENPSPVPANVTITPQTLQLIKRTDYSGVTVPHQQDPVLNETDTYAPNYVRLSDVRGYGELGDYFDYEYPVPEDSSLLVLSLFFDFDSFMNGTDTVYADDIKISSLYLYDWNDANEDTEISSDELSMVSRAGSYGTVQELRISDPNSVFEHEPVVGIYPVPIRLSYWSGITQNNATEMEYTLSASYYAWDSWDAVWTDERAVTVPGGGSAAVNATLIAAPDLATGVHQGVVAFDGESSSVRVPVSFVVKERIDAADSTLRIDGARSDDVMYGNGYMKGSFDMFGRYMSGDWRHYYVDINDPTIDTGVIRITWESEDSSMSVFVADPEGRIVSTNAPPGVFGPLAHWSTNDWLGHGWSGVGGGFYPADGSNSTSTHLYVHINQTGTYSMMMHSTLFGGANSTEPFSVIARFFDLDG